mmetsp:Transcript_23812/g.66046  ORF Transcript_23812/g.66046 Transcript_23812/m.66046 type:complete len:461 (-) Transcript_23812:980-2362(-)|eukprot:CAMPEP_0172357232 /NCGR_PEP_ID=MMETSP1060-20121228/1607_1 /TAXON_ID=37318 /ORGANISM="Pseudo-nitzschia pungens, Strain cf. cingulata" /LENGTH=460 /DNA_ID=CAMNT_0013077799 /DNA_START=65 /DNA_END=1447 /DNA_ORIENTATION=-
MDASEVLRATHEEVTSMMASELNNLTSAERDAVLEGVHGVGEVPTEERNPGLLREKLCQMDIELRSITTKPAFDEAQRLCGGSPDGLVNDLAFRIKFLRAERFDVHEAAMRMVNNLEFIREAFGPECLLRPIHLSDMMLDKENQGSDTFLFSGNFFQVMPFRDRLGRRVIIRTGRKFFIDDGIDMETRMKTCLYICQELANDPECQMKGVVIIGFPLVQVKDKPLLPIPVRKIFNLLSRRVVPIRVAAVHLCIPDHPWFRLASYLILQAFPIQFRIRSRVHTGSIEECSYKLTAYGIPGDQIPIKSSGIMKCADHKKFIAFCQEREDAIFRNGCSFRGILCPSSSDIIVGRGPRIKSHTGNERYRLLLQSKYEHYNFASIAKKKEIAFDVIREVHAYGGRFLVPSKNGWIETDDYSARSKVSIAFRDVRKIMNAKKNRKCNNSVSTELSTVVKGEPFGCV